MTESPNGVEKKVWSTALGAVAAGFGSAVCCSGPLVAAAVGVSAAGLSSFLSYRPYFVFAAIGMLWIGFIMLDRQEKLACEPGTACADPATIKKLRRVLWGSGALVLLLGTSARWLPWIL